MSAGPPDSSATSYVSPGSHAFAARAPTVTSSSVPADSRSLQTYWKDEQRATICSVISVTVGTSWTTSWHTTSAASTLKFTSTSSSGQPCSSSALSSSIISPRTSFPTASTSNSGTSTLPSTKTVHVDETQTLTSYPVVTATETVWNTAIRTPTDAPSSSSTSNTVVTYRRTGDAPASFHRWITQHDQQWRPTVLPTPIVSSSLVCFPTSSWDASTPGPFSNTTPVSSSVKTVTPSLSPTISGHRSEIKTTRTHSFTTRTTERLCTTKTQTFTDVMQTSSSSTHISSSHAVPYPSEPEGTLASSTPIVSNTAPSTTSEVGKIIGCVAGSVGASVVILLALLPVLRMCRRKRQRKSSKEAHLSSRGANPDEQKRGSRLLGLSKWQSDRASVSPVGALTSNPLSAQASVHARKADEALISSSRRWWSPHILSRIFRITSHQDERQFESLFNPSRVLTHNKSSPGSLEAPSPGLLVVSSPSDGGPSYPHPTNLLSSSSDDLQNHDDGALEREGWIQIESSNGHPPDLTLSSDAGLDSNHGTAPPPDNFSRPGSGQWLSGKAFSEHKKPSSATHNTQPPSEEANIPCPSWDLDGALPFAENTPQMASVLVSTPSLYPSSNKSLSRSRSYHSLLTHSRSHSRSNSHSHSHSHSHSLPTSHYPSQSRPSHPQKPHFISRSTSLSLHRQVPPSAWTMNFPTTPNPAQPILRYISESATSSSQGGTVSKNTPQGIGLQPFERRRSSVPTRTSSPVGPSVDRASSGVYNRLPSTIDYRRTPYNHQSLEPVGRPQAPRNNYLSSGMALGTSWTARTGFGMSTDGEATRPHSFAATLQGNQFPEFTHPDVGNVALPISPNFLRANAVSEAPATFRSRYSNTLGKLDAEVEDEAAAVQRAGVAAHGSGVSEQGRMPSSHPAVPPTVVSTSRLPLATTSARGREPNLNNGSASNPQPRGARLQVVNADVFHSSSDPFDEGACPQD